MEVRPGYKQTEVGVIPAEWKVTSLGLLGTFSKGQGIRKNEADSGDLPCVRYGEIYTHHNDIVRAYNSRISRGVAATSRRLTKGDILFAGSGETKEEIGKAVAYVGDDEAYAGGDIVILSPRSASSEFLGYLLNAPLAARQKASKGQGDAVVHISASALGAVVIPLPPLPEQRAIATALSDVDALLDGLDRLIAKKRDLKQAAMQQLLTGETRLPGFTGEWPLRKLGDHVRFLKTGSHSRAQMIADGPVRNLHYGEIHACSGVYLHPRSLPALLHDQCSQLDRLQHGDLILADASEDRDGIGKSVEIDNAEGAEAVAGLHTIAARFDDDVLADGFKGYLQFCGPFANGLRRLAAGTKVYAITRSHLASIEMQLPPVDEQRAIATVFRDMDAEIEVLERRRAKTADLKVAMMQELLTGKTRLVTQELVHA